MPRPESVAAYAAMLAAARADANVAAVIVTGSHGAGVFDTPASDIDLRIVTFEPDDRWMTAHGDPVESWAMTLEAFRSHGLRGTSTAWDRPTFLHVRVDVDRTDGLIAGSIEAKARLAPDEARDVASAALDDYLNSVVRSLRNLEAGRELEGRLDGLETIAPLLTAVFAFEGRVRPYNKWLRHELSIRPSNDWDPIPTVDGLAADPRPDRQRAALRVMERLARAAGHGDVVDGWGPELPWLRGEGG